MSYDTGMSSKMKEFELRHCEKKTKPAEKQNIINWCDYIIETYKTKGISQEIKNEIKIDDITEIRQKLYECFLRKEEIELFKNYIYNLTYCINCMRDPEYPLQIGIAPEYLNKCKPYFQIQAEKFAREYEENKISNQSNIMSSMTSGKSMLSFISGANSKKMASSIMTSMSKLNDKLMEQISKPGEKIKFAEKPPVQVTPEEKQAQVSCITNAFIELYNNYYDTQKIETKDTQKRTKLDEHKGKRKVKINKHLKKSIEILFYPTEQDKKPNLKKENKSNYDISLEKFNNYINDICTKYKVENIEKLIEVFKEDTNLKKFARQIQSLQMCCAAREIQETFMENGLSAGIKFN